MKCSAARSWLFRRLDGELERQEADALDAHLENCPSCVREFRLLSLPRRIGRAVPILEPSPFFYRKLRARLEREEQAVTIWQMILGLSRHLVPGLAAITLALLAVFFYFQLSGPAVDVSQAYEGIFNPDDRPQRLIIDDQNDITDETVLRAVARSIAEDDAAPKPAPPGEAPRK